MGEDKKGKRSIKIRLRLCNLIDWKDLRILKKNYSFSIFYISQPPKVFQLGFELGGSVQECWCVKGWKWTGENCKPAFICSYPESLEKDEQSNIGTIRSSLWFCVCLWENKSFRSAFIYLLINSNIANKESNLFLLVLHLRKSCHSEKCKMYNHVWIFSPSLSHPDFGPRSLWTHLCTILFLLEAANCHIIAISDLSSSCLSLPPTMVKTKGPLPISSWQQCYHTLAAPGFLLNSVILISSCPQPWN